MEYTNIQQSINQNKKKKKSYNSEDIKTFFNYILSQVWHQTFRKSMKKKKSSNGTIPLSPHNERSDLVLHFFFSIETEPKLLLKK